MLSIFSDSTVQKVFDILLDLFDLLVTKWCTRVFDSVVLEVGRDQLLSYIFTKAFQLLLRKFVMEFVEDVFNMGK